MSSGVSPREIRACLALEVAARRMELRKYHRTHQGKPLRFFEWPFLDEIYRDECADICIKSSAKSGKSEWLFATDMAVTSLGMNVLHILPDRAVNRRFVQARVDPAILHTPAYRNIVNQKYLTTDDKKKVDSIELKKVGSAYVNYVGSNSPGTFYEYVADALIIDEYDRCDQNNLIIAPRRLDASSLKLQIYVSNPSVEGHGIDSLFRKSDQKHWSILCRACGEDQVLDFFKNICEIKTDSDGEVTGYSLLEKDPGGEQDMQVLCRKCGRAINRLERDPKFCRWVAQVPGAAWSGYHLSQIYSPWVGVRELWNRLQTAQDNPEHLQMFYNLCLGLGYSPKGRAYTHALLNKCVRDYYLTEHYDPGTGTCIAGIDVGGVFHVKISDVDFRLRQRRMVACGPVSGWENLGPYLRKFKVSRVVIDAAPEIQASISWQRQMLDQGLEVWRCDHAVSDLSVHAPKLDRGKKIIHVARTLMYDMAFEHWRSGVNLLPRNASTLYDGEFYKQMCLNVRFLTKDSHHRPVYKWTGSKPDHYWSADGFERMAFELGGGASIAPEEIFTAGAVKAEVM